jgi:hypothetical protein
VDNLAIWNAIKLGRYDRGVLIGKTDCGKTTLANFLINDPNKRYSVVWNPKGSKGIYEWDHTHINNLTELKDNDNTEKRLDWITGRIIETQRLVYTPLPILAEDENDQYDFFYWIYERKYTRLYIDEATSVCYSSSKAPRYLTAVLNRGRERGISTLTATQRPSGVPMNILSESEHYYVFRTLLPQDQDRIKAITGISIEDQLGLKDHEFFYFNVSRGLFPTKLKLNLKGE